jgi:D-alanine-D-alanine ligase-like ATP-grasp enzyme
MGWTDHRCGPYVNVYLHDEPKEDRSPDLLDKIHEQMVTACDEVAKRFIDPASGVDIVVS